MTAPADADAAVSVVGVGLPRGLDVGAAASAATDELSAAAALGPWILGAVGLAAALDLARGLPWTKRLLQEVLRAFVVLDLGAQATLRRLFPPRYELLGACQRRGACCTQIVAAPPRSLLRRPRLLAAFVALHRVLHNFHVVGRGPEGQVLFRCGFLQPGGRCGIYRFRPRLCRTYPVLPFFAPPKVLPGCGYRVKRRGLSGHERLRVLDPHVGVLHETPPTRPNDGALEHPEDFVLVTAQWIRGRNPTPAAPP